MSNIIFAQDYEGESRERLQFYPTQASIAHMDKYSHMFVYSDMIHVRGIFSFNPDKTITIDLHTDDGQTSNIHLTDIQTLTQRKDEIIFYSGNIVVYIYDDTVVVQAPSTIMVLYK